MQCSKIMSSDKAKICDTYSTHDIPTFSWKKETIFKSSHAIKFICEIFYTNISISKILSKWKCLLFSAMMVERTKELLNQRNALL